MNHLRQQAVGNIIIMMYFGAKIFLNKENPVYEFFKNKGAIIFSINELNNQVINTKLSEEEIKKNRQILKEYWSEDIMIKKTEKLIETMRNC
jgi:isochorismate hydrolase